MAKIKATQYGGSFQYIASTHDDRAIGSITRRGEPSRRFFEPEKSVRISIDELTEVLTLMQSLEEKDHA